MKRITVRGRTISKAVSPRVRWFAYDEKLMFPISGSGWVVERVKAPTMNRGSLVTKRVQVANRTAAIKFLKTVKRK